MVFSLWNRRSYFFNPNKMTNQPKVLILGGNSNLKLFVFLFPLIQSINICGICFHSISQVGKHSFQWAINWNENDMRQFEKGEKYKEDVDNY